MLDLSQYFERIGYQGRPRADLATLQALTRAHAQSIPFENLDVRLGRPIDLTPQALFDKLVCQRRGGYCFEQNGLFAGVLEQLGFCVEPLGARVRLRFPDRAVLPPRTHLFLQVELDGQRWLTDVGFGGFSLTAALRWQDGLEQVTPHDRRRLVRDGARWFQQVWQPGGWQDLYEFSGERMEWCDQQVASWYSSTHPDSLFTRQLVAARALADGGRVSLLDDELRLRPAAGGEPQLHRLTPAELAVALSRHFGLELPPGTDPGRLLPP